MTQTYFFILSFYFKDQLGFIMLGIAITGMGVVNQAGKNREDFFQQLSRPYIGLASYLPKKQRKLNDPSAFVRSKHFTEPNNKKYNHATGRLCLTAAKECLENFLSTNSNGKIEELILGTSTGGYDQVEEILSSIMELHNKSKLFQTNTQFVKQGVMESTALLVASELNIPGRSTTISNSSNSSALAIIKGAATIAKGHFSAVMVGGGDTVPPSVINRFGASGLLDSELCQPFSERRHGLNLGEGAGFLVLEPLDLVVTEKRPYYAELLSYGISNDPYDLTRPNHYTKASKQAMMNALESGGIDPYKIDFIIAQGLGTLEHDRAEAEAIQSLFPNQPLVSSIKALTGHTLGASGVMNVISALYSLKFKTSFPNFNNGRTSVDCPINITNGYTPLKKSPFILVNSFSLSGSYCSLILTLK